MLKPKLTVIQTNVVKKRLWRSVGLVPSRSRSHNRFISSWAGSNVNVPGSCYVSHHPLSKYGNDSSSSIESWPDHSYNSIFCRRRFVSSSSSTPTNVETVWREKTGHLLDAPIGSLTENDWNECHKCILWWLQTTSNNNGSRIVNDSMIQPLLLLDRMNLEAASSTSSSQGTSNELFDTDLLNLVINHWRKSVSECLGGSSLAPSQMSIDEGLHPQQIIDRIHKFQNTVESNLKPNTQTYAMIIDGASAFKNMKGKDGILAAERLFEWLMERCTDDRNFRPNVYTFTSLMDGWKESGRPESARKVQDILEQMEMLDLEHPDWDISPNIVSYSVAIESWAKAGKVDNVEDLLYDMREKYIELGQQDLKPTLRTFNGYLVALAKAGQVDRAESVLEQMHDLYKEGELDESPSVISYSTVLDACAKSNHEGAGERAEMILRGMLNKGIEPNTISYNSVINAYVKSGNFDRAEHLLSEMHEASLQGNPNVKPMAQTYTVVLSGLSKTMSPNSGERGEKILDVMKELAKSGDLDTPPNVIAYNSVLDCWAKSSSKDAPERAKKFLQQMIDSDEVLPDLYSYNTVIAALTRAGRIRDAESMFHAMSKGGINPDVTTYNTLLAKLSKSGPGGGGDNRDKINELFKKMKQDETVEPDLVTYNIILNVHKNAGHADEAQAILNEMMDDESNVRADTYSCNTVISAWSKSGREDAPDHAESILSSMLSDDSKVTPDTTTFNAVMGVWVRSKFPEAADRCERLLGMMNEMVKFGNNHSVRPDVVSYNTFISSCAYHQPVEEGPDLAEAAFHEMQRRYEEAGERWLKPTAKTYGSLIHVWSKSNRSEAGEKAESYLRELIRISETQGGWNRRVSLRIFEFVATIRAWANSCDPLAIYKADEILYLLLQQFRNTDNEALHPNARLFEDILKVLASSNLKNKPKYADALVGLMKQYNVKPRAGIVQNLRRCYSERIEEQRQIQQQSTVRE